MKELITNSRRHFFKLTGISILGYSLLSLLPFKSIKNKGSKKLRKVKINSSAVKRKQFKL